VNTEVIKTILAAAANSALPALIKEHSYLTSAGDRQVAKSVLEPLIMDVARTREGERYVVGLFAQKHEASLTATEIGKQIIVQAAKGLLERARTEVKPNATMPVNNKAQQLLVISNLVATANKDKLEPAKLTEGTAREFLQFVARIQQCYDPAAVKNIARAKRASARTAKAPAYYQNAKTRGGAAKRIAQKTLRQGNVAERARLIKDVLGAARDGNLTIPKAIIESIYAGAAGVNLTSNKANVQGLFQTPQETASASSLKRVVAALEAQATRGVTSKDPSAAARTFSLIAVQFLRDLIKRLAKQTTGNASEIDEIQAEIIKALTEERSVDELIKTTEEIIDPAKKYSDIKLTLMTEYIAAVALKVSLARRQPVLTAAAA
jgi:hypothetical protein